MPKISKKLIARYLSNECTNSEKLKIQNVFKKHPEFEAEIEKLKSVWNLQRKQDKYLDIDVAWQNVRSRTERSFNTAPKKSFRERIQEIVWQLVPSVPTTRKVFAYSLVLFMFLSVTYYYYNKSNQISQSSDIYAFQTIKVKNGRRYNVTLPDGSKITLDAGSELRYPNEFTDKRQVFLSGEAYFEVAHDPSRPFCVNANNALVRVLGTKFNVRAWNENPSVKVTVNCGKVALSPLTGTKGDSIILTKNEMGILEANNLLKKTSNISAKDYLAWMDNEIKFDNASVEEVLAQLHRWYDYEFIVKDSSVLKDRVTVQILNTNVNDVLQIISVLTNTKIIRESKKIQLVPKN